MLAFDMGRVWTKRPVFIVTETMNRSHDIELRDEEPDN